MAGGELTLHPAAAYFGRQVAEFGLLTGLAATLAVVGYDATLVELTGSLTLGVLVYGLIELVTERDVIPRGRLLPVPSYASVTPPSGEDRLYARPRPLTIGI